MAEWLPESNAPSDVEQISDEIRQNMSKNEVLNKIQTGELMLVDKSKDSRSRNRELWSKFSTVVRQKDGENTNYVSCNKCKEVFKHHNQKSGTTHLKTHSEACKGNTPKSGQTSMRAFVKPTTSGQEKHAKAIARKRAVEMCARDVKPFTLLEGEGFRAFAQSMIDIGAQMGKMKVEDILPDRRTVSNDTKVTFENKKQELRKMLQCCITEGKMIGATTDLWTDDIKHQHYMSLTVHVEEKWVLTSRLATLKFLPSSIKKTAVNIRSEVLSAFKDLGIDGEAVKSRVFFATDCGANVVKALSVFNWVGCGCHQLATVLRHVFAVTKEEVAYVDILLNIERDETEGDIVCPREPDAREHEIEAMQQVNKQLDALSKIVTYLKKTGLNGQLPHSVYQENKTRWNSRLNSLRSVIRQMDDVVSILQREGQTNLVENVDIELLTIVSEFLQPFEDATKEMEADHVPTLHKVVLWFYELQKILSAPSSVQIRRSLNARALRFLEQKFTVGTFHKVAVFLCPMYRRLVMFPADVRAEVLSSVTQYINNFPEPVMQADSVGDGAAAAAAAAAHDSHSDHGYAPVAKRPYRFAAFEDNDDAADAPEDQITQYTRATFQYPSDELFNPLAFWRDNAQQFPKLAHVARCIFCCPAASSASERAFSNAGAVYSKRRGGNMAPSTLEALCFLHSECKGAK